VTPAKNPGPRKIIAKPDETAKLFARAKPWQRVWLLFCSQLALRNAEGRSIHPKHFNPETQTITFTKKGKGTHELPVTPDILAVINAAPEPPEGQEDWTYVERWRGKRLTKAAVEHHWRKLKKECGVREDLRVHDLRRTTAVALYDLTKDLRAVSHLLGHASLSATCGYLAHQDPQTLRPLLAQMKLATEIKQ
jgi:site-specific recombinase XerC